MVREFEKVVHENVSVLVIVDRNGGISQDGQLLWDIGADNNWFNDRTKGKVVVMSRETFERVGSVPIPNTINVVVTRDRGYVVPRRVILCHSMEEVIKEFEEIPELIVVGGIRAYEKFLPIADKIYLARLDTVLDAVRFFPKVDWSEWERHTYVKRQPEIGFSYSFNTYMRRVPKGRGRVWSQ